MKRLFRGSDAEDFTQALNTEPAPHNPVVRLYPDKCICIESGLTEADDDLVSEWTWDEFLAWEGGQGIAETDLGALALDMAEGIK